MVDELGMITELLLKYISGRPLEEQELLRLQSWLEESPDNTLLLIQMQSEGWLEEQLLEVGQVDKDKIWAPVAAHIEAQQPGPVRKMTWHKYAGAAAILLVLFFGGIFVARRSQVNVPTWQKKFVVPDGQTSQVQLPDGTRVWLDGGSTMTAFAGKYREVILEGEAYFDVAKDANYPFRVRAKDQIVTVLGTSFNIRCRVKERSVSTTLETGKVSVSKGSKSIDLLPGQQARTDSGTSDISMKEIKKIDDILSWKSGYFHFDDMDIPSAIYELAKWYKLGVDIKKGIPNGALFKGNIPRSIALDSLVENLNLLRKDLHIKLIGKTITVMP